MKKEDKQEFMNSILQVAKGKCDCECHKEGTDIMHMFPCCDKTYKKFK